MHIDDLIDPLDLAEAIETGYVREQTSHDPAQRASSSATWPAPTKTRW